MPKKNLIGGEWRDSNNVLEVKNVSTFRVDHMPYGGIKASGYGREGVKFAIEDMTELRLMVLNLG
jgi:acyl-CoA reductase-like NAD-dependent aldehyde dehydrogenase